MENNVIQYWDSKGNPVAALVFQTGEQTIANSIVSAQEVINHIDGLVGKILSRYLGVEIDNSSSETGGIVYEH